MSSAESRATRDEELPQRLRDIRAGRAPANDPGYSVLRDEANAVPTAMGHAIAPKRDPTGARASRATGR